MSGGRGSDRGALIAAAIIMVVVVLGWLAMPRLMLLASDAGPIGGVLLALAFMLAFFGVFWLRGRYQARRDKR